MSHARSDDQQERDLRDHPRHRVRLPGFIHEEKIGLGDAISRVGYAFGLKPCGGCVKRAAAMNRWMAFSK